MKDLSEHSTSTLDALRQCRESITKLEESCCMQERSPYMRDASQRLDDVIVLTEKTMLNHDVAQQVIGTVGELGRLMGYLFATCCTPDREAHYQQIFKLLGMVHTQMWTVLRHDIIHR